MVLSSRRMRSRWLIDPGAHLDLPAIADHTVRMLLAGRGYRL